MNITIVTSPFCCLPPTGIGAIEKRWFNMAIEMGRMGHRVTFICKKPAGKQTQIACQNVRFVFVKGYERTGSIWKDIGLDLIYSVKAIWRLKETDVLVLNTFWTPFVCIFRKSRFRVSMYNVARTPKGQFKYFAHIDRLSCVSSATAKILLEQAPKRKDQVKVISNPVDVQAFAYQAAAHTGAPFRLCYTGRIHPEKGLEMLVQAYALLWRKYTDVRLSLVGAQTIALGGGGSTYCERLNQLAEGAPIDWVAPLSDATQLAMEIAKCDVYCYPSIAERGETFGVAPLEAMAVGRATIVSALECFEDFVTDNVTGLVFDHRDKNPEMRLEEKIEYLIKNPEVRDRISREGSRIAHMQFSTHRIACAYLEDFENLLREENHAQALS